MVIDTAGGDALAAGHALVRKGGLLLTVAGMPSEEKAKELGITVKASGNRNSEPLAKIAEMLTAGTLVVAYGRIFPLAEAAAAQDLSQAGRGRGRILLKMQTESGMSSAQEVLGELLRNEAQLQDEPDGAPAKALAEAISIMDGQLGELPGGVESALKDEGVEVRVEAKRVTEELIGNHRGAEDGLARRGRVVLDDQAEDES